MIGTIVCAAIPYKNFKEKIRITKKYQDCKIEIYKEFVLVINKDKEE
ncbi:hypothetical protein H8S20_19570 [Clostridium sp. NSJ-6]|uniref:Uncharacterized protein n=1 Tax=Clostridium hominis TaxID=2763036 RepID=A0ABR7DHY5_9CLOT|nr:hypothetical protein [Clostridium hominis]MBC5631029.1 hypothetical protein [Clostridium hominis]MDU2672671.1 hypothetical protein [Clostridium sp.]